MHPLLQWDTDLFLAINRGWHHPAATALFWAFSWIGRGEFQIGAVLITALALRLARGAAALSRFARLLWGVTLAAVSGILVHPFKAMWPRWRPAHDLQSLGMWLAPDEPLAGQNSFPSGHAWSAGACFMVLALWLWPRSKPAAIASLLCAVGVALSRIYRGVHYPLDVTVGLMFGMVCGWICWRVIVRGEQSCAVDTPSSANPTI